VSLAVVTEDPDDDRVLECAVAAHADAIVSGDRHLLRLGSFKSIVIQSSRQFLDSKAWETAL
jgi:predicted nucleic acid-binding protein